MTLRPGNLLSLFEKRIQAVSCSRVTYSDFKVFTVHVSQLGLVRLFLQVRPVLHILSTLDLWTGVHIHREMSPHLPILPPSHLHHSGHWPCLCVACFPLPYLGYVPKLSARLASHKGWLSKHSHTGKQFLPVRHHDYCALPTTAESPH